MAGTRSCILQFTFAVRMPCRPAEGRSAAQVERKSVHLRCSTPFQGRRKHFNREGELQNLAHTDHFGMDGNQNEPRRTGMVLDILIFYSFLWENSQPHDKNSDHSLQTVFRKGGKYNALFLFPVLLGCKEQRTRGTFSRFVQTTVNFPSRLLQVCAGTIDTVTIHIERPTLVVYHDRLGCSSCEISHLYNWYGLYKESDNGQFDIIKIFSPSENELPEVLQQLEILNFPYPVYIDFNNNFRCCNKKFPEDRRFHCFLVNTDRKPIFVGNPLTSDKLNDLFEAAINQPNIYTFEH